MSEPRLVEVRRNVLKQNDVIARALREHGQTRSYHSDQIGLTSRLDTLQALVSFSRDAGNSRSHSNTPSNWHALRRMIQSYAHRQSPASNQETRCPMTTRIGIRRLCQLRQ